MKKILVTPRSVSKNGHPALERLRRAGFEVVFCTTGVQPSEQDLMLALPNCVGFLAGVEPISEAVLEKADKLKVISRNGAGINNIDQDAAKRLVIQIRNAPGANVRGVVELALAHIMASIRAIALHDGVVKSNDWQRRKGMELENANSRRSPSSFASVNRRFTPYFVGLRRRRCVTRIMGQPGIRSRFDVKKAVIARGSMSNQR